MQAENRQENRGWGRAVRAVLLCLLACGLSLRSADWTQAQPAPTGFSEGKAAAALVMDAASGELLFARHPDKRLPPASLTKILTGLMLAQRLPPETLLPVSPRAAPAPGSALGLRSGQSLSARDALYALLMHSANDAAVAAAESLAGSEAAFAEAMNAEARRLGATRTHFANPHGLDAPNHLSTARDLATLARAALRNPAFAQAAGTKTYSIALHPGRLPRLLTHTNRLLWTLPGMEGGKTGRTRAAGFCFVGWARRGGKRLIVVVLNSPDWQGEAKALLAEGFARRSGAAGPESGDGGLAPAPRRETAPAGREKPQDAEESPPAPRSPGGEDGFDLLWWLLGLIPVGIALWHFGRRMRPGELLMRLPLLFPARHAPRQSEKEARAQPGAGGAALPFAYTLPALQRGGSRDWLTSLRQAPERLRDPAIRRQARDILDADPRLLTEEMESLLDDSRLQVRVAAADILGAHLPRRAGETLHAVLDDAQASADLRAEAAEILARQEGDRLEAMWLQRLLRDGSPPAARALARLPRLSEPTVTALRRLVTMEPGAESGSARRRPEQEAMAACLLAAQGALPPEATAPFLDALPPERREALLTDMLRGSSSEWAAGMLLEAALWGRALPAMEALLAGDPETLRPALNARREGLAGADRARADALAWLLFGEGESGAVRRLAEAGDDAAAAAWNLACLHRADLAPMPSGALLAAARIVSLRLGFGTCTQEQLAAALRAATAGEEPPPGQALELTALARANAQPEVQDAVQIALHSEDGLSALLASLALGPQNASIHAECAAPAGSARSNDSSQNADVQAECAFWSDKVPAPTRLLLTQSLCAGNAEREAVAARAADPCPLSRAAALRSLHARPQSPAAPAEAPDSVLPPGASASGEPLDRAA